MASLMSTKITKGGQTTVPREIRDALGVQEGQRVYWLFDGTTASITSEPPLPAEVHSEEEFWQGIEAAMADVRGGRLMDAREASRGLREKYGL